MSNAKSHTAISLKLPDELAEDSGKYAEALGISRAEYIRRAVEEKNQRTRAEIRARRLAAASHKVRKESMQVNAEFAAFEKDPDA